MKTERNFYDNGIRFVVAGGMLVALVALIHLTTACGIGYTSGTPLMTQRVSALLMFGVMMTLFWGGVLMSVIILPCVAGKTFQFEARQRRRDIYPIFGVFCCYRSDSRSHIHNSSS